MRKLLGAKSLLALLCFTILVIGVAMSALADEKKEKIKHVLLLNSYHQRMTWVKDIVKGVEDVIRPNENNISLHIENMDTKLFSSSDYFDIFRDYLRVKYRNTHFSLILSSDNNAYDFLRQNRNTLFPGVPVSFCGVNNFNNEQIADLERFTGVAEIFSARETVELALQLHPDVTELFVINDYLKTGRAWTKDIDTDLLGMARRVKIRHAKNLVISKLMDEISQLGPESLVLLGVYFSDRNGQYFTYERIGAKLSQASKVPVYCLLEFNIGKGIVGGQVISGYYQGKTMAQLGMKILGGVDLTSLPVKIEGSNRVVFDHSQLIRFDIDESLLPQESHVINRPYSFYKTYKTQIWMMVGFIVALVVTILALVVNIMRRLRAERALREREGEFKSLFENNPISCWLEDFSAVKNYFDELRADGVSDLKDHFNEQPNAVIKCSQMVKIKDVNQATLVLHKAKNKEELFQGLEKTFTPESLIVFQKELIDMWNGKTETAYDAIVKTLDNELRYITMSYKIAPGHEESLDNVLVTLINNTGQKKEEEEKRNLTVQLQHSQKMEAIGTLAGGIAHDFNNILGAIIGYTEMARDDSPHDSQAAKDLDKVLEASTRATDLVKQILSFSRQDETEFILLQPANVLNKTITMLRPTLPSTIEITQDIDSATNLIFADPTQIHQILMNLCTNAFHAMEETGGNLDISLKEIDLCREDIAHELHADTGTFIQLSVSDSGPGMTQEVKDKIFDPYFTTKGVGKGTGMGLSIVHGIIKSYGGFITLSSEPGKGTSFHIFLPVVSEELLPEKEAIKHIPVGKEKVLFIDDEGLLADMGKDMLERLGYHVTVRKSSFEALETFQNQPDHFDLVITDQTMPGMTGIDLARRMLQTRPDIPIILCTGYSSTTSEKKAKSMGIKAFALKPLSKKDIAVLIRKVLDANHEYPSKT